MATTPDSHPDSDPSGPSTDVEHVSPTEEPGRDSVEDVPAEHAADDSPGTEGGTSGTGGTNHRQDSDVTS